MFKSSENLRLAADMRALERVARPWREVRRSWFDGTPQSIEARLAATERVIAYARGGSTPAHVELEREASTARAELREASHRLMVDFLDDGARAFKGSKRVVRNYPLGPGYDRPGFGPDDVAEYEDHLHHHDYHTDPDDLHALEHRLRPGMDDDDPARYSSRHTARGRGLRECINCGGALSAEDDDDAESECGTCGKSAHQEGVDWRKKSYRSGGAKTDLSGSGTQGWPSAPDQVSAGSPPVMSVAEGLGQVALNGSTMTGQEPPAPFNPGPPRRSSGRTAGGPHDDPYHGKQWPDDFPLPEGTPAKWNDDDDTLTCPNCGYDEVELNRSSTCPECDHFDPDFLDDSDGDHNSFESQMERKYPILPEHGGPSSGLWGGKWGPRPFESARLAAGLPGYTPSHGFPITEGDEVHYVGAGTKGHPDKVKGTVLEYPALGPNFENEDDPDADEDVLRHDAALVYWGEPDEGDTSIEFVDDIVPNQHLNEYSRKLRRQSSLRTASNGGLDWKSVFPDDDGTRGHEATTEVGDLVQTHPEYQVGKHPTRPGVNIVRSDLPPVGWGYGIWTNEPPEDGDYDTDDWRNGGDRDGEYVHQGDNGRTIYPTHDEAKAAAEEHYYSLDHSQRQRGYHDHGGGPDSGVDYSDLNKFMDEGGPGQGKGGPGDDFDYGDIFGKESRLFARLAASGMSHDDIIKHIDDVLAQGEGHDLHHQPGVKGLEPEYRRPAEVRDHCRACGGDGRAEGTFDAGDSYENCEACDGTGENQGDPYGECEGCGADTQIEDLSGDPETGLYCPDCGQACDYCGLSGGGHRHGCPER